MKGTSGILGTLPYYSQLSTIGTGSGKTLNAAVKHRAGQKTYVLN